MGLGISFFTALKSLILFISCTCLRILRFTLFPITFLYASLVSILIAIVSHPSINLPLFLGKGSDGTFPPWSLVLFGPFLYLVRAFSILRRFKSGEPPYSEVYEGLYVGGWPYSPDTLPPGNPAIIDCTCELPRKKSLSGSAYLCIPTWDMRAPRLDQIEAAVSWACEKRAQKTPVFIHCAFGHGRSVTVMCALLVALGSAEDWKAAEKMIEAKRPCIHLNALHRKALEEWSKIRLSKNGEAKENFAPE